MSAPRTRLGSSSLEVYPLSLGGNVFGWTADEAQSFAVLDGYADAGELRCDDRTREVVRFVRRAPLRRSLRPSYAVLFGGAVASLEPRFRDLLGLRMPHLGPIQLPAKAATRLVLRGAGSLLGEQTAGERAARVRLEALGDERQTIRTRARPPG